LVRNVHFKQAARKHRPVNQHYFIFQILTEKKSLPQVTPRAWAEAQKKQVPLAAAA